LPALACLNVLGVSSVLSEGCIHDQSN
jgi:hypothetical protein